MAPDFRNVEKLPRYPLLGSCQTDRQAPYQRKNVAGLVKSYCPRTPEILVKTWDGVTNKVAA